MFHLSKLVGSHYIVAYRMPLVDWAPQTFLFCGEPYTANINGSELYSGMTYMRMFL